MRTRLLRLATMSCLAMLLLGSTGLAAPRLRLRPTWPVGAPLLLTGTVTGERLPALDSVRVMVYHGHHLVGETWTRKGMFVLPLTPIAARARHLQVMVPPQHFRQKLGFQRCTLRSQRVVVSPRDAQGVELRYKIRWNWGTLRKRHAFHPAPPRRCQRFNPI